MTPITSHVWAIRPSFNLRETFAFRRARALLDKPHAEGDFWEPFTLSEILKVQAGTAHIFIQGAILPGAWRCEGTDTDTLRAAVAKAVADPAVNAIRLVIDSPGGAVPGIPQIAAMLRDAGKPVSAHVKSDCCSAAYWLASQATAGITAERGAFIGCLGVYQVLVDDSKLYKDVGIDVRVYASDPVKGLGVTGAPINDEQDAFLREHIAELADLFWADIHAARPKVPRSAFSGRWHLPEAAAELNLVDDFYL